MSRAILIVDDEPLIRMELAEMARSEGLEPYEAATTTEALAMIQAAPESFVAMITDVQMPGTRNGLVLANHVSHQWPHIRVIVVSGGRKPFPGELPHGTPFIAKPYHQPDLSAAISGSVSG